MSEADGLVLPQTPEQTLGSVTTMLHQMLEKAYAARVVLAEARELGVEIDGITYQYLNCLQVGIQPTRSIVGSMLEDLTATLHKRGVTITEEELTERIALLKQNDVLR